MLMLYIPISTWLSGFSARTSTFAYHPSIQNIHLSSTASRAPPLSSPGTPTLSGVVSTSSHFECTGAFATAPVLAIVFPVA